VTFHSPVRADDTTLETPAQTMQMTRKINALFESWIRERPQEWMCTKRRWSKHLTKPDWRGKED
jgi:KDO2-lipid IV(A) lauroyltransferase